MDVLPHAWDRIVLISSSFRFFFPDTDLCGESRDTAEFLNLRDSLSSYYCREGEGTGPSSNHWACGGSMKASSCVNGSRVWGSACTLTTSHEDAAQHKADKLPDHFPVSPTMQLPWSRSSVYPARYCYLFGLSQKAGLSLWPPWCFFFI